MTNQPKGGKDGLVVTRGCFTGTKEDFLEKSAQVHSEKIQREYQLLIEVAESRINHHKAPEPNTAADWLNGKPLSENSG